MTFSFHFFRTAVHCELRRTAKESGFILPHEYLAVVRTTHSRHMSTGTLWSITGRIESDDVSLGVETIYLQDLSEAFPPRIFYGCRKGSLESKIPRF